MNQIARTADFTIKVIMMFTTLVTLLHFTGIYNQLMFTVLSLLFLIAIVTKGVSDVARRTE